MARLTPSQFERGNYKVSGQWCLLYGPDDHRKQEAPTPRNQALLRDRTSQPNFSTAALNFCWGSAT